MSKTTNWDLEYLGIARYVAARLSKDPSTKCGAVISRPDNTIASLGVNGFPRGCDDSPELFADRQVKYPRVIHAEQNALSFARERLDGCTMHIWVPAPFVPTCATCAGLIIQSGIWRVVYPHTEQSDFGDRWRENCAHAARMYAEVGVEIVAVAEDAWRMLPSLEVRRWQQPPPF
jgi:dCMP deaminase